MRAMPTEESSPRIVHAPDGVPLAVFSTGAGPPLLLLHGAMSDHRRWRITPLLSSSLTVHAMDRRGRGASGDSVDWSLDHEVDDVIAVVEALASAADTPVDMLGHSLGGLLALRAAARTDRIARLVLYEPAVDEPAADPELLDRMWSLLAQDRRDDLVELMMREVVLMPDAEIAAIRAQPTWPSRVAAAHTVPREMGVALKADPDELAAVRQPTLLLVGGDSPGPMQDETRALAQSLHNVTMVTLAGQQHIADQIAPEEFTRHVLAFLVGEPWRGR